MIRIISQRATRHSANGFLLRHPCSAYGKLQPVGRRRRLPGSSLLQLSRSQKLCESAAADQRRFLSSSNGDNSAAGSQSSMPILPPTDSNEVEDGNNSPVRTQYAMPVLPPADPNEVEDGSSVVGGFSLDSLLLPKGDSDAISIRQKTVATPSKTMKVKIRGRGGQPHFLSPINLSEGQLRQGPCQILHNQYAMFLGKGDISFERCYSYETMEVGGERMHCATFICPASGSSFSSGTMHSDTWESMYPSAESLDAVTITSQKDGSIQSNSFYRNKKIAQNAAAARAIDSLSLTYFRDAHGSSAAIPEGSLFRLCLEEPKISEPAQDLASKKLVTPEPRTIRTDKSKRFTPVRFLGAKFSRSGEGSKLQKSVELTKRSEGGETRWTATYKDTSTGRQFEAGTLRGDLRDIWGAKDPKTFDGKVYYFSKKAAVMAVAARVVDALFLSEFLDKGGEGIVNGEGASTEGRLCIEPVTTLNNEVVDGDYFMSAKGSFAFSSPKDFLRQNYITHRGVSQRAVLDGISVFSKGDGEKGDYWFSSTFKCPISGELFPAGTLQSDIDLDQDVRVIDGDVCYKHERQAHQAACARAIDNFSFREFLDRQTGFDSDVGIDESYVMRLCVEEPYLRGVSSLPLLSHPGSIATLKRIELPSSVLGDDSRDLIDEGVASSLANSEDPTDYQPTGKLIQVGPLSKVCEDDLDVDGNNSDGSYEDEYDELDSDDDEEHVIQFLPGALASNEGDVQTEPLARTLSQSSTLERVLDAWVQPSEIAADAKSNSHVAQLMPPSRSFTMDSVKNALYWFHRLEHGVEISTENDSGKAKYQPKRTIGTLRQNPVSAAASINILKSLEAANKMLSFQEQRDLNLQAEMNFKKHNLHLGKHKGAIESIANHILNKLLDTSDPDFGEESSEYHGRKPTVEMLNSVIGCVCRQTPAETAVAAEKILTMMLSQENGMMPLPNVETFNLVLGLWALVPGQFGRQKVEEIFLALTCTDLPTSSEIPSQSTLQPNRKTFAAALFGLSQVGHDSESGSHFARDEAKLWIERMHEFASKYDDDSLLPDTEIYNAALRWSGSLSTRASDWDDYGTIYNRGFKDALGDVQADLNSIAESMERWLLDMEEFSKSDTRVYPNIVSYESIIQALVATGSSENVIRAEKWAQRTIAAAASRSAPNDCRTSPTSRTFHPIIAAWAYSGYTDRVQEWNDILEGLSKNEATEIVLDGRMKEAHIVAWHERQRLACDSSNVETFELASTAAHNCMKYFEDLCTSSKSQIKDQSESFLAFDASCVERVIGAWGTVAEYEEMQGEEVEHLVEDTVSEIFRTIDLFDDLIELYRTALLDDKDSNESEKRKYHMNHLMTRSSTIYSKAISIIGQIDWDKKATDSASAMSSLVPKIEAMLRRAEFYNVALSEKGLSTESKMRKFRDDHNVMRYSDGFSYANVKYTGELDDHHPHYNLYSSILDICESLAACKQYGDALRFASFIQRRLNSSVDTTDLSSRIDSLVCKLVQSEHEKEAVVKALHQSQSIDFDVRNQLQGQDGGDDLNAQNQVNVGQEPNSSTDPRKAKKRKRIAKKRRFPSPTRRAVRSSSGRRY